MSYTTVELTVPPRVSNWASHWTAEPVSVHDASAELSVILKTSRSLGRGQVGMRNEMLSMAPAGSWTTLPSLAQANTRR